MRQQFEVVLDEMVTTVSCKKELKPKELTVR